MRDPSCFGECVTRVGQIMMGLAIQIVSETLKESDTALRESLLREAAHGSYEKAGELSGGDGSVSRQTVMRHVHGLSFPIPKKEEPVGKRRVRSPGEGESLPIRIPK